MSTFPKTAIKHRKEGTMKTETIDVRTGLLEALRACELLVEAYSENDSTQIKWEDLDFAYATARGALVKLGMEPEEEYP
jgi:hypothetical protein